MTILREYPCPYSYGGLSIPYTNPNRGPGICRGTKAVFLIVAAAKAELVDTETFRIWWRNAAGVSETHSFEFDVLGNSGTADTVMDISAVTTSAEVFDIMHAAFTAAAIPWTLVGGGTGGPGWGRYKMIYPGWAQAPTENITTPSFQLVREYAGTPAASMKPGRFGPVRAMLPLDYISSQH